MFRIEGLEAGYRGSRVLQGIELAVGDGEIMALLGRNGMGKTTLLRTIIGLLPAARGRIRLGEHDLIGLRPHAVARMGVAYVPQGRELFADLTVAENLELGVLGTGGEVPATLLEDFPVLAERARQKAGTLSGGEQQQLAIARALAARPRLLLLDEPSEGLQPSMIDQIARTLAAINRRDRLAVLLVEQSIDLVLELAGRAALIENGRIVAEHAMDALRREPALLERHLAV